MNNRLPQINVLSFLMVAAFLTGVLADIHGCPRGFYHNPRGSGSTFLERCSLCSTCHSGQGVKEACLSRSDTVCEPCVVGETFAAGWGQGKFCRACKKCGPYRDVITKCTLHSDTQCGDCKLGSYWNPILNVCEPCSWCFPDVYEPRERYVARQCVHEVIPPNYQCAVLAISVEQTTWLSTLSDPHKDNEEASGDVGSGDDTIESSGNHHVLFVSDDEDLNPKTSESRVKPKGRELSDEYYTTSTQTANPKNPDSSTTFTETTRSDYVKSSTTGHEGQILLLAVTSRDDVNSSGNWGLTVALAVTATICFLLTIALIVVSRKYFRIKRTSDLKSLTADSDVTLEDDGLLDDVCVRN